MGPVLVIYISFAAISLFACFLQLFLLYRKSGELLFLFCSVLSVAVFINFSVLALGSSVAVITFSPFTLLKYQLILYLVVIICIPGVVYLLLDDKRKLSILLNITALGILLLVSLFIPDNILFGASTTTRRFVSQYGDDILMIGTGFTLWRALIDLAMAIFVFYTLVLLIRKMYIISYGKIVVLFCGLGIILLAALFDQLIDLGQIQSSYMLPFALFIFYIILTCMSILCYIKKVFSQQNIIHQGQKWLYLVNQADVIVVGLDRMGHVEFINPYFYTITGYKEDEVLGKDWFEFFIPPKEYYNVQSAFVEILEFEFHPHYLNPILTKDKEERLIRWFNVRTRNKQGNITGSLSIGIDVTNEINESDILAKKLSEAERLIANLVKKG
jgi:PAS domain S-box-containing protein